jgi:hypothetical protein
MESAGLRAHFPGGFQNFGGIGAAAVDYTLTFAPLQSGGNLRNYYIRSGDENEIGDVNYLLVAGTSHAAFNCPSQFFGRSESTAGNSRDRIAAFSESDSKGAADSAGSDDTNL